MMFFFMCSISVLYLSVFPGDGYLKSQKICASQLVSSQPYECYFDPNDASVEVQSKRYEYWSLTGLSLAPTGLG